MLIYTTMQRVYVNSPCTVSLWSVGTVHFFIYLALVFVQANNCLLRFQCS